MKLHNLKPAEGSTRDRKRVGRGQGSGRGGTSTRGHKGAKSRSGFSNKRAFEGGQMPLQMRLPKRGFNNVNRMEYVAVNLSRLQAIADKYNRTDLDLKALCELGIIRSTDRIKVLANGNLKTGITVEAHAVSGKAKEAIESAGGTITLV